MIKIIAFIVLLVHGIGHLQGVVISSGLLSIKGNWNSSSWLFDKFLRDDPIRFICLGLHLVAASSALHQR